MRPDSYAATPKGIAMMCLDYWDDADKQIVAMMSGQKEKFENDIAYLRGKMLAYGCVLECITGVISSPECVDEWRERVRQMR